MIFFKNISNRFEEIVNYAKPNINIVGYLGFIGFPAYYFIWQYLYPQQYENLYLRLFCACLFLIWIFYKKLPSAIKSYFSLYFIFSSFICLPYFFSFMLIRNHYSDIWLMSLVTSIYLLILLIYDWKIICIMIFGGFGLALLTTITNGDKVNIFLFNTSYVPIILFALVGGIVCNYRNEIKKQQKESLLKSLSGSIAHEMRNPLATMNMIFDNIIQNDFNDQDEMIYLGQTSIKRTNQIIDLILNQINEKNLTKDKFTQLKASITVRKAIKEFTFDDEKQQNIVKINVINDFSFKANETLFIYIIFNLLKNSLSSLLGIKEPSITIEIKENKIFFTDNGEGISKEKIKNIFDSFVSHRSGGTGLGLSFCKRTMISFGGNIECKSEKDKYTQFILTFSKI